MNPSALFGATLGYLTAKRSAGLIAAGGCVAGIVPFSAVCAWVAHKTSQSDSLWFLPVLVYGMPGALTGFLSCKITELIFQKRKD